MELYDYQKEVVKKAIDVLRNHKLCYLGLEMRLGKTPIALTIAKGYKSVLFVTTKSAMKDVIKTNEKYFGNSALVINYESVHKIPKTYKFDLIIADEAHKIGKFPKKTIARRILESFVSNFTDVLYLSGTPNIESGSQLYHQLTLSKHSPFKQFKNFYDWHREYGIENYVRRYGGTLVKDYKETQDFSHTYNHLIIRMTREDANFVQHDVTVDLILFDLLDDARSIYNAVSRDGIFKLWNTSNGSDVTITTNGSPATRLIKLQQITGGSIIADDNKAYEFSSSKLSYLKTLDKNEKIVIYHKYKAEKQMIEDYVATCGFTNKPLILQIDSNNTGVDLSHLDRMIIYSLTFSGSNYAQVLSRMANKDRKDKIVVDILLAKDTIDLDIYNAVSDKKNFNSSYLRKEKRDRR